MRRVLVHESRNEKAGEEPRPFHFYPGDDRLSRPVAGAVPWALEGLTTVFGMGTGVSPPVRSPERSRTGVRRRVLGARGKGSLSPTPETCHLEPAFLTVRCL